MDFNIALQKVGDFGLYQKLLCAFLVVPSASFCALVYFAQFFIIMVPDHWCNVPQSTDVNISESQLKDMFIPKEASNSHEYSKCSIYETNISILHNYTSISEVPVTKCRNGWSYNYTMLYPTIATELDWVCENDRLPYWVQTVFYIGTSLGCIVFGYIADRFGRRPSIIISYALACTAGIASAFVSSFEAFISLRFFVGACIIPLSEDPYVLSLEYIGVKKRTLAVIVWSGGYIVFSAICPWIAYGLQDWRMLCIVSSAPLALVVFCGMLIPESASWLLTRGRKEEAVKLLKTVAWVNRTELPEEFGIPLEEDKSKILQTELEHSALDLFRTPRLRKYSLVLAIVWFVIYCTYHTNTQNASNLGTSVYDSFTYGALVEIPASFMVLFGIDWLGRRWPMVIATTIAGIAGIFIIFIPTGTHDAFLGLALLQRVTLTTEYTIIIQYSAEVYPTVLRGRGLAFLRVMGTLGLYLSPSIVYLALSSPALPLLVSGIMALAIAALSLFLPETLNHHLPHTLEEGERFGANQRVFDCPCLQARESLNAPASV